MRFLADENIPLDAVRALRTAGLDIASAFERMQGASDSALLDTATQEGRVVLTFDKDFAELVFRERSKASSGVILLRIRPSSPASITELLIRLLLSDEPWEGHFSVVTDRRIRMVPLP